MPAITAAHAPPDFREERRLKSPDDELLAATAVSKRFGGVRAVEDLSFSARRGEIASIIGPNGAGKTSLLNMISGFYRPDTGSITFGGHDITRSRRLPHRAPRETIGARVAMECWWTAALCWIRCR